LDPSRFRVELKELKLTARALQNNLKFSQKQIGRELKLTLPYTCLEQNLSRCSFNIIEVQPTNHSKGVQMLINMDNTERRIFLVGFLVLCGIVICLVVPEASSVVITVVVGGVKGSIETKKDESSKK